MKASTLDTAGPSVAGTYRQNGYAVSKTLVQAAIAGALLDQFWRGLRDGSLPIQHRQNPDIQDCPTSELRSTLHPPLEAFHWGLTSAISSLLEIELLPTYCMMRLYRQGDRLRVHRDRWHCEHSATVPIGSSDHLPWPIEIGNNGTGHAPASTDFGDEPFRSVDLEPGEALLYRGPDRRHGRMTPNPNRWSLHLFLHCVDANGPHRDLAFSAG